MTNDASTLLAAALKTATLHGSFSTLDIGAKIGLNKSQAEAAARGLSDMGVLVLGYEGAAHFSPEYRKAHGPSAKKPRKKRAS